MFDGSNCDRKSQLSGILTEPLNPRERLSCEAMRLNSFLFKIPNNEFNRFLKIRLNYKLNFN